MLMIGLIIELVSVISFILFIIDYDKNYLGIFISFIFMVIGIWLVMYDVNSPVEITKNKVFITTEFNSTTYSEPVKITTYDRKATGFMCIAKDTHNFKFEIEILSPEAIEYWGGAIE